ncbi:MAG: hypothetical protein R3C97_07695 [Geminicoccaceae bacterium]
MSSRPYREFRRDPAGDEFRQLVVVGGQIEHRNAGAAEHGGKARDDQVAQLIADLAGGEMLVRADDFPQEDARIGDADLVGAEGAQADHAELGITDDDRVLGSPFEVRVAGAC